MINAIWLFDKIFLPKNFWVILMSNQKLEGYYQLIKGRLAKTEYSYICTV